jgi:putative tricarboxylic transport membrane protein
VRPWRLAFAAAAWLFFAGVVVQVFLAGVGLFELGGWDPHVNLGWLLGSAPLVLVLLAVPARFDRRTNGLIIGLTLATFLQPELAAARTSAPLLAAFHPVNALLVFWLAWIVARRTTDLARRRPGGEADGAAAGSQSAGISAAAPTPPAARP